jgi:hypothetical protein
MIIRIGSQKVSLKPFIGATIGWAAICMGLIFALSSEPVAALRAWGLFYFLGVTDLFFLVKTIAATLVLMSDQVAENRIAYTIQALVYGSLKMLCLAAIAIFLWKFPEVASKGSLLGLARRGHETKGRRTHSRADPHL